MGNNSILAAERRKTPTRMKRRSIPERFLFKDKRFSSHGIAVLRTKREEDEDESRRIIQNSWFKILIDFQLLAAAARKKMFGISCGKAARQKINFSRVIARLRRSLHRMEIKIHEDNWISARPISSRRTSAIRARDVAFNKKWLSSTGEHTNYLQSMALMMSKKHDLMITLNSAEQRATRTEEFSFRAPFSGHRNTKTIKETKNISCQFHVCTIVLRISSSPFGLNG